MESAGVLNKMKGPYAQRIEYILEWNLENSSVLILSAPYSLKGSSKCTNHVNVHKLYAVEYMYTVCSLDQGYIEEKEGAIGFPYTLL